MNLANVILIIMWFAGMVAANGVLSTVFAIFFPPWSFYLAIEMVLTNIGWLM